MDDMDFIDTEMEMHKNVSKCFKQTFNSQKCDCGLFRPAISKCSLNICDNCCWSKVMPEENAPEIYCLKQEN